MTKESMTVHRALAELKTIDARIEKAINSATYIAAVKHSAEKINGISVSDFKNNMKSDYQKITDLIARRDAMKRAVVLSNATTKLTIAGKEYTVAEAIEIKNHGIEFKRSLLNSIAFANDFAQKELNRHSGDAIEKAAEQYVLAVIAAQPKDAKMAIDSDAMNALRADYIKNNSYDLIDPMDVNKIIKRLSDEIDEFEVDVDSALSVSNSVTVIEFEY